MKYKTGDKVKDAVKVKCKFPVAWLFKPESDFSFNDEKRKHGDLLLSDVYGKVFDVIDRDTFIKFFDLSLDKETEIQRFFESNDNKRQAITIARKLMVYVGLDKFTIDSLALKSGTRIGILKEQIYILMGFNLCKEYNRGKHLQPTYKISLDPNDMRALIEEQKSRLERDLEIVNRQLSEL